MNGPRNEANALKIIQDFSVWTTQSALRQAPIRSRAGVRALLKSINFSEVLDPSKGPITLQEFEAWHARSAEAISANPKLHNAYGWSSKILNIYLKTACYVGGLGRQHLVNHLHPPIDSGLWIGLARRFKGHPALIHTHHVQRINAINSMAQYTRIIDGMKQLADEDNCLLIELEKYWLDSL